VFVYVCVCVCVYVCAQERQKSSTPSPTNPHASPPRSLFVHENKKRPEPTRETKLGPLYRLAGKADLYTQCEAVSAFCFLSGVLQCVAVCCWDCCIDWREKQIFILGASNLCLLFSFRCVAVCWQFVAAL